MTKKSFSIYRIIAVIIVSITVGIFINFGNWYLPMISIILSWILLYTLRKRVKEIMADERDYVLAGKSSIITIKIYISFSVIIGIILYSIGKESEAMFNIATTLLYSACFLMFLYSVLFKIYERKN